MASAESRPELSWRSHAQELARNPAMVVWVLFLLTSPLYVVPSGLPQPGDWLVILMVPVTLLGWSGSLDRERAGMVRALMWFTVWIFVVNYAWALILGRWRTPKDFVIHPFFYLFNSFVFLCALVLARKNRERFLAITVDVVFLTIIVQVAASFFFSITLRGSVFFNSPNQLGYYSLLSACLFAMAQRPLGMSRLKGAVGITLCAYLAALSASRSSVAGILVLLVVLLFSNPRTIIAACIAAVALVSIGGPVANAIESSQQRVMENRNPTTTFAQERGYERIWRRPEYLVTGAGEGAYERFVFHKHDTAREVHSSFGSVLFGYGLIGLGLFAVFGVRVVRKAPWRVTAMLVPALIYTIAHQGLRFTMFWVVLAAFVVLKPMPQDAKRRHVGRLPASS
jgi:hypothetical protein